MTPSNKWNTSAICVPCCPCMCVCHAALACMPWRMHMCAITHSWRMHMCAMTHDACICVQSLIHTSYMTNSYVAWRIQMCDMTQSYVTWHIQMSDMMQSYLRNATHSYVWHDSFIRMALSICMTWNMKNWKLRRDWPTRSAPTNCTRLTWYVYVSSYDVLCTQACTYKHVDQCWYIDPK